jgi:membrane protein implicated in regulation of membrane protease activity
MLIALTIWLFGVSATDGPLQVALLLSAAFASLIAFKNGYTAATIGDAAVGGVTTAVGAIFILLAVGALIGTWNMSGTIATVVDYGIRVLNPSVFFLATAVVCATVGTITGSSWTTAGTLGVAFVGMGSVLGRRSTPRSNPRRRGRLPEAQQELGRGRPCSRRVGDRHRRHGNVKCPPGWRMRTRTFGARHAANAVNRAAAAASESYGARR